MKVQIQQQAVRVRIDEDELSRLFAGDPVENRTRLPDLASWALRIVLCDAPYAHASVRDGDLQVSLPRCDVTALRERLPSREGLQYRLGEAATALTLQFDVDMRDSIRQRGVVRRSSESAASSV